MSEVKEAGDVQNRGGSSDPPLNTSFAGRGREAAVPERGLPFDVERRSGLVGRSTDTEADAWGHQTVAELFSAWTWGPGGRRTEGGPRDGADPSPQDLRQPSRQFFARFPWDGRSGQTRP